MTDSLIQRRERNALDTLFGGNKPEPLRVRDDQLPDVFKAILDDVLKGTLSVVGKPLSAVDNSFDEDSTPFIPPYHLTHSDDGFTVIVSLAGYSEHDITIKTENGMLTVSGKAPDIFYEEEEDDSVEILKSTLEYGDFEMAVGLPSAVKSEDITASLRNGLLVVTIPRPAEFKPRSISISTGINPEKLAKADEALADQAPTS